MSAPAVVCGCAVCELDIVEGQAMADHFKYEIDGELDYIELAHEACGRADNAERECSYWRVDPSQEPNRAFEPHNGPKIPR